jgi:UDP-glucose:(heptosyl)LPS alpha-1,3-glucosyltransferase
LRLAIIRQRYTPYGGAERFIENALEALLERNVAISLYTREWPETNLQLMEPQIVDPFHVGRLWRDVGFAHAVCRKIRRAQPELVQSHERLLCCDIFRAGDGVHAVWLEERARSASTLRKLAFAASPYHRYVQWMERRVFANPSLSAVICNSKMVKDEIALRFGVPDAKLFVIYNAVDSDAFSPALRADRSATRARHGIADGALVFLLVGSGYQRKGVATALEALAQLPERAHLLVVGKDNRMGLYQRLAREHGVANRVTFAGPQADPKPYFGAADAFVLPTLYDPLPNAALEAMACALPVITTNKSGAAELVVEADAGFVCISRDAHSLAGHMRALEDDALRERMGSNARAAMLPLSPAAMTLKLVLLYKELLEASAARKRSAKAPPPNAIAPPAVPASDVVTARADAPQAIDGSSHQAPGDSPEQAPPATDTREPSQG